MTEWRRLWPSLKAAFLCELYTYFSEKCAPIADSIMEIKWKSDFADIKVKARLSKKAKENSNPEILKYYREAITMISRWQKGERAF